MLSLEEAVDSVADLRVTRDGKMMCPSGHDKDSPSLHLYYDTDSFFCFGCGANGDAIGFLHLVTGRSFSELLKQHGEGFLPTDATRGMNRHQVQVEARLGLVEQSQVLFDAIRFSDLGFWRKEALLLAASRDWDWLQASLEEMTPAEKDRFARRELPQWIARYLNERQVL